MLLISLLVPSLSVSVDSMDSSLIAGTNQSLLCFLDSTPLPVVFTTWLKNGSPVNTSDSRVITSTTLGNSTLTISSLRTSDGGQSGHFSMVSLRVCATAANKHKIWIKSSSKKRWQRLKLQSCISAELYRQTIIHASCSYREFVKSLPK